MNIGTLKVSIWPRAVVTLKDVEMLDPEAPPENRRPIAWLHEADISLNWKKLLDGQVDPERVNVEGLSVSMPVDKERPERVFSRRRAECGDRPEPPRHGGPHEGGSRGAREYGSPPREAFPQGRRRAETLC